MAFNTYTGGNDASLVNFLLGANSGVVVDTNTIVLRASGQQAVNFYDGSIASLGIGAGLLLTSGYAPGLVNDIGWDGTDNSASSGFYNGDADIDAVVNTVFQTQSYDATTLEFDFTVSDPNATSISFDIVFGSEEFPEWVDQFVDCAVVMVNGVNYALFNHDPLHPLSVVSSNLAAGYFQDNAGNLLAIQYDGVSQVLKIVAPVNGGVSNHIKIGIADTGDHIYDSGLFIANLSAGNIPGSGVVSSSGGCTTGDDTVTGSLKDEYFDLQAGNDTVYAGAGDDIIVGGAGNDQEYAGSGADQLEGDAGDDWLDGGADSDTAVFTGNVADYAVALGANGATVVTSSEGVDTLVNVEFVKFKDGLYSLAGDMLTLVDPGTGGTPANSPGMAAVAGVGAVGNTLTALVSDPDGIVGDIAYQWSADGIALAGETAATLLVDAAYAGAVINFTASYTDGKAVTENLASDGKAIASANDGDFAIELLQLTAPAGATVENPLTTLAYDLIQLGVSPNEAGVMLKNVFGIDPAIDLRTYDSWAALSANPNDAQALAVEKLLVQIAVITSAGGDQSGIALAQAVVAAAAAGTPIDLADPAFITAFIGADPFGVINEIQDRNANLRDAVDVAKLETEWADFQSGLAIPVSNTVADLSVHLNQAPEGAASLNFQTAAETALTLTLTDLVAGFTDPDGDALSVVGLAADQGGGLVDNNDGTWTFTPSVGYSGPVELTYSVIDGLGGTATATTMLIVAPAPVVNNAPALTGSPALLVNGSEDTAYIVSDADLLAGFSDADGDPLAVAGLGASDGVLVANGDGTYTVTPGANYHGTVVLGYEVIDGQGGATAASLSYTLAAVNDAPTGGVSIAGVAKQGQTLTASNTLADVDGLGTIGYQWLADGIAIAGANAASYTLTQGELGKTISVAASYTDGDGTPESVASAATAAVQAPDLTLTGTTGADVLSGGAGNDTINGLGGNDTLNGNAGNDILDGGAGKDKMAGGTGDDTYYVGASGDSVIEAIGAGNDTVISSISSYTLSSNVEHLTLDGAGANGTGNTLDNTLLGNALANNLTGLGGNDVLDGGAGNDKLVGGAGNDLLTGGAGADIFRFDAALNAGNNLDAILDFVAVDDSIQLENAIFGVFKKAGALAAGNFVANAVGSAVDANDFIVYNTTTGALSYDADGSGAGAAVEFATLVGQPAITAADFVVT